MTCIFTRFFCIYLFTCEKGRGIAGFQDQQNANCQSGPLHLQKIEKNQEMKMFLVTWLHFSSFVRKKSTEFQSSGKNAFVHPTYYQNNGLRFFSSEFVIL